MQTIHQALIDSELIQASDLADGLLTQLEQSPLAIRMLLDRQLITPYQVIEIMDLQQQQSLSLKQACESINIWNDQMQAAIDDRLKYSKTLCQILTEKGHLDTTRLMTQLEQLATTKKPINGLALPTSETLGRTNTEHPDTTSENTVETNAAENAMGFEPEFWSRNRISEATVSDYLDLFSEEKKEALENEVLALNAIDRSDSDEMDRILDSTFRDYHSIKGASRTVSAPITEALIHALEDIIAFFKTYWKQLGEDDVANLVTINLSVLDAIWELRSGIEEYQTEEPLWSDSEKREHYTGILTTVGGMQGELDSKNLNVNLDEMEDLF